MIKTSVKIILSAVLALVLGYVLGIWISFPNLKGDSLKGDIGKASKFSQKATADEIKAEEELLQNDTAYLHGVLATLNFADERINLFANLVSMTTSVCEGVDGLQPVLAQVQGLQGMAANAQSACNDAVAAVSAISKGEEANYEQAMNDITLAYAMVSRSSKIAKNVVSTFDSSIGSKHNDSSNGLAFVRDEWVRFAASEALLQSDEVALDYWGSVSPMLADKEMLNSVKKELIIPITNSDVLYATAPMSMGFLNILDSRKALISFFPGLSGFPNSERLISIFPGISGFPNSERMLNMTLLSFISPQIKALSLTERR